MESEPERLGHKAVETVESAQTELYLSAASSWEIAIKYALGKLKLPMPPARYVPDRLRRSNIISLPVRSEHALAVADLPLIHRDPFDRMLVAQAVTEKMTLITADSLVARYDVAFLFV